jgi:hypothetical protein
MGAATAAPITQAFCLKSYCPSQMFKGRFDVGSPGA